MTNSVIKYIRYGADGNTIVEQYCVGIGALPERTRQALYLCEPGRIIPIAYFLKDEYAELIVGLFNDILHHRGHIK